jgi:NAD+ synthase
VPGSEGTEQWPALADRIAGFIAETTHGLGRGGALIGLSGGLDSTTTAALSVRGLGADRVLGLIMPDRESDPAHTRAARGAGDWLGIRTETVDITAQLEALGAYDFPLSRLPGRRLRAAAVRLAHGLLRAWPGVRPFIDSLTGSEGTILAGASASFRAKHRVRMVTAAYRAERAKLLLVGAANRTEKLTGVFCKFGIDHCADIMPIGPLYRSEVLRLAEALGVPEDIRTSPPDPGIVPGVRDKYRFFLGVPADAIDRPLRALADGADPAEAARRCGLSLQQVTRLREAMEASWHARNPSLEPELP